MTKIKTLIKSKEHECFKFTPGPEFYKAVGINGRRWARIYRGEIIPNIDEAKSIAAFFGVPVTELI